RKGSNGPTRARRPALAGLALLGLVAVSGPPGAVRAQAPQAWVLTGFSVFRSDTNGHVAQIDEADDSTRSFQWSGRTQSNRAYPELGTLNVSATLRVELPHKLVTGQGFTIGTSAFGTVGMPGRTGAWPAAAYLILDTTCGVTRLCPEKADAKLQYNAQ